MQCFPFAFSAKRGTSDVNDVFIFSEDQNEAKHTLTQVSIVCASNTFGVPLYFYFFLFPVAALATPVIPVILKTVL